MSQCPFCDYVTPDEGDTWQEVAHMQVAHPEVIAQRLRDAGLDAEPGFGEAPILSVIGPSGHNTIRTLTEENARLREVTEAQSRAIEALRQAGADKRRQLRGAVALLDDLSDVLAEVQRGELRTDDPRVNDVLRRSVLHVNGGQ